jgi:hypothetical protein
LGARLLKKGPADWVARRFVFKPKIPIWVNFGGCCDGSCWYITYYMVICSILWPSGLFYGFLVCFKVIWYILPVLVSCSKKNVATLRLQKRRRTSSGRQTWKRAMGQAHEKAKKWLTAIAEAKGGEAFQRQ